MISRMMSTQNKKILTGQQTIGTIISVGAIRYKIVTGGIPFSTFGPSMTFTPGIRVAVYPGYAGDSNETPPIWYWYGVPGTGASLGNTLVFFQRVEILV
jgi:hypothetical protein